ncbi:MAG TPA: hypothetical protein DET40_20895 [Lentisphaeria bacterium]|nr:MAG: hypothetical protein A2X45_15515 [Lentisphaerae bacterium GWF2_50_93]HCE46011.1 hypothetical protein [Lentisphaeria bacterium]
MTAPPEPGNPWVFQVLFPAPDWIPAFSVGTTKRILGDQQLQDMPINFHNMEIIALYFHTVLTTAPYRRIISLLKNYFHNME